jgi:hypothetical protein
VVIVVVNRPQEMTFSIFASLRLFRQQNLLMMETTAARVEIKHIKDVPLTLDEIC